MLGELPRSEVGGVTHALRDCSEVDAKMTAVAPIASEKRHKSDVCWSDRMSSTQQVHAGGYLRPEG